MWAAPPVAWCFRFEKQHARTLNQGLEALRQWRHRRQVNRTLHWRLDVHPRSVQRLTYKLRKSRKAAETLKEDVQEKARWPWGEAPSLEAASEAADEVFACLHQMSTEVPWLASIHRSWMSSIEDNRRINWQHLWQTSVSLEVDLWQQDLLQCRYLSDKKLPTAPKRAILPALWLQTKRNQPWELIAIGWHWWQIERCLIGPFASELHFRIICFHRGPRRNPSEGLY